MTALTVPQPPPPARTAGSSKHYSVLPGFNLTLGYTLVYLSLVVLIPLAACFIKASGLGWREFWTVVSADNAVAAYKLSLYASLIAAAINAVFGVLSAWVLVRYSFPGRRVIDALIDLPFALPTAVAGLALTALYSKHGWFGAMGTNFRDLLAIAGWHLSPDAFSWLNLNWAYKPSGIVVALTFTGMPFVVRTVQPVLQELSAEVEEAAASLGARRLQIFIRVILPEIMPAVLTGFALAFARAVGEYGSVVFISTNRPYSTQIAPMVIFEKLEGQRYADAAAIAVVMLAASFVVLLAINVIQRWSSSRSEG